MLFLWLQILFAGVENEGDGKEYENPLVLRHLSLEFNIVYLPTVK